MNVRMWYARLSIELRQNPLIKSFPLTYVYTQPLVLNLVGPQVAHVLSILKQGVVICLCFTHVIG